MEKMLQEVNIISCCVRILLALFFGGLLGMERGRKRRPAGLRTYMLVCTASALVMITNQYMVKLYPDIDPSRMAAQVISGIGFLGAGTIIITGKNRVKGLTTAAGLWASACVGLAIGIGFYYGAIIGGISIFLVMEVMQSFDDRMMAGAKVLAVYMEFENITALGRFMEYSRNNGITVSDMEMFHQDNCQEDKIAGIFTLKLEHKLPHSKVIELVLAAEGVEFAEEV